MNWASRCFSSGISHSRATTRLLFTDSRGQWVILDYKTNRLEPGGKQELARHYEFQLGLYAMVFNELYKELPKKGLLYFSSLNEFHEFSLTPEILQGIKDKMHSNLAKLLPAGELA